MRATDLDLLITAARAAGETATKLAGGPLDVTRKGDNSPVTNADIAVNTVLHDILQTARPDYAWLSEESPDDSARLHHDTTFIIDPIDGTRSFIDGSDTWAHSLAIAHKGRITAAVVFLPKRGKLYSASLGSGAYLNGQTITASTAPKLGDAHILTTKPNLDAAHWPHGAPAFKRSHRPSLAYRLSLVAEGRYDAMFTFRPSWEWDIAAGALIASEAGARTSDRTGQTLRFNNPTPQTDGIIVGSAGVWGDVVARLG